MSRVVLTPGPEHPITVTPNPHRVVVTRGGEVIADTRAALVLQEASYPGVQYIPRTDVNLGLLERSDHETYCPYKGDASYYTIQAGDAAAENAVWTYEAPYDQVAEIKGHLAFYPNQVEIREEPAGRTRRGRVSRPPTTRLSGLFPVEWPVTAAHSARNCPLNRGAGGARAVRRRKLHPGD